MYSKLHSCSLYFFNTLFEGVFILFYVIKSLKILPLWMVSIQERLIKVVYNGASTVLFAKKRENNQILIALLYINNDKLIVFGWYLVKSAIVGELKFQRKPQFFNTTGNNSAHKQQFWIYKKHTSLSPISYFFFSFKPPTLISPDNCR